MDFQMSTTDTYSHVGGSGLISDPISLARLHDSIKAHCATAVPPSFAGLQNRGLTPPLSRYLCFWTSAAAFSVDEKSVSPEEISSARDTFDYYVRGKDERVIGTITLSQKWRRAQSNKLELIVLAVLNGHLLHVMAIERVDGIAQRVQILNEPIEQGIWLRANPQRKFITLG